MHFIRKESDIRIEKMGKISAETGRWLINCSTRKDSVLLIFQIHLIAKKFEIEARVERVRKVSEEKCQYGRHR